MVVAQVSVPKYISQRQPDKKQSKLFAFTTQTFGLGFLKVTKLRSKIKLQTTKY